MKRLANTLLALALAAASATGAALAQSPELPAALWDTLPDAAFATAAIEAHPGVARARGEQAAAHARAGGRQRGPHDWIGGGQWQQRDVDGEGRFDEWELSLQRAVRLPGKAALDRRMAELEIEVGADTLADARHVAATGLLHAWTEWLTASELAALADETAGIAGRDLEATTLRLGAGHAAAAEHDAAVAAEAGARRALEDARLREQEARLALGLRYPALHLPARAPRIAVPGDEAIDWNAWATRVVDVSHDITLSQGRADLAELWAERARLDRRADPSIGVRAMSERGGDETVLGVFFSVPLGAGPRRATADEAAAMAASSWADATTSRTEVTLQARTLARRAELQRKAWTLADTAARAQANEAERLARGHALDGVDLSDLLMARRRATEAAMAEVDARALAFVAMAGLLLDAHAYWIDDDGHSGHDDGRNVAMPSSH
ncbi:MAG TPA: TolC family protein [Luteimonas sp.]|nr:TolC family protein [Luteimonas sp.]HRP72958.1 TolC family protein [Luteimonas sp.]